MWDSMECKTPLFGSLHWQWAMIASSFYAVCYERIMEAPSFIKGPDKQESSWRALEALILLNVLLMHSNHSTLIIYAIWLKFSILKILSRKKSSYETSVITIWFWFVKHRWSFANSLYIKKEIMYNFVIKIIINEVYYVKYYCQAWLWWKILYSFLFIYFFLYLYVVYPIIQCFYTY